MKGLCGYGRYNDEPEHVGCPRAKSDMTPCIARDGHLALTDWDDLENPVRCVGCDIAPWDALVEIKKLSFALGDLSVIDEDGKWKSDAELAADIRGFWKRGAKGIVVVGLDETVLQFLSRNGIARSPIQASDATLDQSHPNSSFRGVAR